MMSLLSTALIAAGLVIALRGFVLGRSIDWEDARRAARSAPDGPERRAIRSTVRHVGIGAALATLGALLPGGAAS